MHEDGPLKKDSKKSKIQTMWMKISKKDKKSQGNQNQNNAQSEALPKM